MTDHSLTTRVAELLREHPDDLEAAGIDDEPHLQGWLSARNLRLVAVDPREPEISPGFWSAEHHDGCCVVMYDESASDADAPVDVSPGDLRRALVLVPLDPARPSGHLLHQVVRNPGSVEAVLTAPGAEAAIQAHDSVELQAGRGVVRQVLRRHWHLLCQREARPAADAHRG